MSERHAPDGGADPAIAELDLRGLLCPQPVLRTAAQAATLPAGSVLVALCSDPGVQQDMPIWCRMHGHRLEAIDVHGHDYRVRIRLGTFDRSGDSSGDSSVDSSGAGSGDRPGGNPGDRSGDG